MGGLNKQGEEKNRVPDTAHDCPILRIGVVHEQPVSEIENLSKWELFYFFHSLSLLHTDRTDLYDPISLGIQARGLQIYTDISVIHTIFLSFHSTSDIF